MAVNLRRILNSAGFIFLSVILFCLILLTPVDAIYQCYKTSRLTNIFFITGAYVITFILAVLIYATRIYTNRTVLTRIPKAWIPVEREDVGTSVRRLVMEGLARSAIISYQARPRDTVVDEDSFSEYELLTIDREQPPWGQVEHPGWSSPSSTDFPDLPYKTVVLELPHLIEAKAVSLAPPDPLLSSATRDPFGPSSSVPAENTVPDTRVVQVLQRPASMGLREYIQHLTAINVVNPPEIGAEFLAHYEPARFSSHELSEPEFRDLMHVFAELLRGMKSLDSQTLDEIRGGTSSVDTESVIGPSDEEGETDTVDHHEDPWLRSRSNSLQPSNASTWEGRSVYATPIAHSHRSPPSRYYDTTHRLTTPRTPSPRSLRRVRSNISASSGGSVIRLVDTQRPSDLPYTIDLGGNANNRP